MTYILYMIFICIYHPSLDFYLFWRGTLSDCLCARVTHTRWYHRERGWNRQINMLENGRFYHSIYLFVLLLTEKQQSVLFIRLIFHIFCVSIIIWFICTGSIHILHNAQVFNWTVTEDRVNIWNFTKQRGNYLHHVQIKTRLNILPVHINQIIILTQKIWNINLINRTDCCFSVKSRTKRYIEITINWEK
jgi:hypothetical protein